TKEWSRRRALPGKRWQWIAVAIAAVVVAVTAAIFLRGGNGLAGPASVASSSPYQPPAMSIAVLPFVVAGDQSTDERLAQSLTQDVTAALERSARYALVASYGTASIHKGKALDARSAGRDLNVRYLVEGDMRQDGDKVAVGARMIDAAT